MHIEVIVQIRVGGLPPTSKHREELKLTFLTNFKVLWNRTKSHLRVLEHISQTIP